MTIEELLARLDVLANRLLTRRNEIACLYLETHSKPPFPPTAETDEKVKEEVLPHLYQLYREAERLHMAVVQLHTDVRIGMYEE